MLKMLQILSTAEKPLSGFFFLRGLVDEVGTAIRNHSGYIYIPNLAENLDEVL